MRQIRKFFSQKQTLLLGLIILIAIFFRFYRLGMVPPSPSLDEVSIGWNSYSILETGRDEYGTKLPILLRAYDDWRPALYVYLVIPFIKILGLSVTAVRLPSVLLSLITVFATYFLVQELFKNSKNKVNYSLVAAFLLAISPWHIYISRLGHEVNAGLTFSILAIFFFLKGVHRKKLIFFISSAIFFALSFYSYQSQKIFGPLIILSLGLIYRKQLWQLKKEVIVAGLVGLLLLIPIIKVSFTPEAMIRFQGTSIFVNQPELSQRTAERIARDYQQGNILGLILDSRRVAMGLVVLRAYLSHFDLTWLLFNSGAENHKVPSLGLFYLWELPLLLIGGYQLATGRFSQKSKLLIFSWLFIAPLSASITTDAPHAMRTFNVLPIPQILTAIGMMTIMKRIKLKPWLIALVIIFLFFSLCYLYHNYFVNFPYEQSDSFQYPLAQAIKYVLPIEDQYQKIVISNQNHGYQSYMFYLFFSQYGPKLYLNQGGTISGGYNKTHQFGKYEFRPIEWGREIKEGVLYMGNFNDFPETITPLREFDLLNGEKAIYVVE